MRLTGKAKDLFEAWYFKLPNSMGLNYGTLELTMNRFYCLPESMQWGLYQDWADSLGYELYVDKNTPISFGWGLFYLIKEIDSGDLKTRQEARNAAIEKLNQLINEK